GGTNRPGPLSDLNSVGAASGQKLHAFSAAHVPSDQRQFWKCFSQHPHRVAYTFAMTMRGGNGHDINSVINQFAHVRKDPVPIQFAKRIAGRRYSRPADQPEMSIPGGFELRVAFLNDPFD